MIELLRSVTFDSLSTVQVDALITVDIYQNIGAEGAARVQKIVDNTMDMANAASETAEMRKALDLGVQQVVALDNAIDPFDQLVDQYEAPDSILARVAFTNDASINDLNEWRMWSQELYLIGKGFAAAEGKNPQDVEVVGASRGSIVVEIAAWVGLYILINKAIKLTLENISMYREWVTKGSGTSPDERSRRVIDRFFGRNRKQIRRESRRNQGRNHRQDRDRGH